SDTSRIGCHFLSGYDLNHIVLVVSLLQEQPRVLTGDIDISARQYETGGFRQRSAQNLEHARVGLYDRNARSPETPRQPDVCSTGLPQEKDSRMLLKPICDGGRSLIQDLRFVRRLDVQNRAVHIAVAKNRELRRWRLGRVDTRKEREMQKA